MKSTHQHLLIPLILFLLTFMVFGNTLFHRFTYDDHKVIEGNRLISSMTGIPDLFSQEYFEKTTEKSYRPVVTATYFVDCFIWGKRPVGYHLTNVLIHCVTVILVYIFLGSFYRDRGIRFVCALLFAVHPVVCEPVNSISFREDLLAGFFVLAAWVSLLRFANRRSYGMVVSAFFAMCAYFSKESALPLVFPLGLYFLLWKNRKRIAEEKKRSLIFWLQQLSVVVFYLLIRFVFMAPDMGGETQVLGGSRVAAWAHAGFLFLKTWRLFLMPIHLNADYVFWNIRGAVTIEAVAGFLFFACHLLVLYLLWRKGFLKLVFGLGWILIFFLPVSNLIPLTNPFAERYLYLPLVGLVVVAGGLIEYAVKKGRESGRAGFQHVWRHIAGFIILVMIFLSVQRNLVWSTDKTLWEATLRREPRSVRALNGVALELIAEERYSEAEDLLKKARHIKPLDYEIRNNLAIVYLQTNRPSMALTELERALEIKPDYATAHYNLAKYYLSHGEEWREKALNHARKAAHYGYEKSHHLIEKIEGYSNSNQE